MTKELNEEQFKKLGELLSDAVKNRETLHPLDSYRAAVLIFSLVQKGYNFGGEELEGVMQESGGGYSESMEEHLNEILWVCKALNEGLSENTNERFKLKDFD